MSLFASSPLLRAALGSAPKTVGAMRYMPSTLSHTRFLTTSNASRGLTWAKPTATRPVSEASDLKELNVVRNDRPISPHMTIYQPQLTWYSSIFNRITGVGLSVTLYTFMTAYAVAPLLGWGDCLSSANLAQYIAELPQWVKLLVKAPLAVAMSFHTFNGLRHLSWDAGYCTYYYSHSP